MVKDNHYKIGYLAREEKARLLLKTLLVESELTHDVISKDMSVKDSILETLVDFGFIEQSNKVSYGFKKSDALVSSVYTITDFGANFINNYDTLYSTSSVDSVVQLSSGDFVCFRDALEIFTTSDDALAVRESYEFIFGVGSKNSNFYNLSKNKLVTMYRKMYELKKYVFKVVTLDSYQQVLKKYRSQISEFASIANEITSVLSKDGYLINKRLTRFLEEKDTNSDFYEVKARQVFGTNIVDLKESELILQKVVVNLSEEILGVSDRGIGMAQTYIALLRRIIKLATDLGVQLDNLSVQMPLKAECMRLADSIGSMDSLEEAQQAFTSVLSNRPLSFVSQGEKAQFKGSTLYVESQEEKVRAVKSVEEIIDSEALILEELKGTLKFVEQRLEQLETVQKVVSLPSVNGVVLDGSSYQAVSDSLARSEVRDYVPSKFELQAEVSSSNTDFVLRTYVEDVGKVRRKTFKNRKVVFYVRGDLEREIEKVKGSISRYTSEINQRESS